MGRVRLALFLMCGCALLVFPFGSFAGLSAQTTGAGAWSRNGQSAAGVSFTLQKPSACVAPGVVLGSSCVDKSRMVVADKWVVGDGTAQRNTDLYQTSFSWIVPPTIPAGGASMPLKLTATGLQGNRICPALSVRGGFGSSDLLQCAESGQSVSPSLSAKLMPPSATAGATALLVVSVLDGPVYTYTYRAAATAVSVTLAVKTPDGPFGPSAEVEVGTEVQFQAVVTPSLPAGAKVLIGYKTAGGRLVGKTCPAAPCLGRTQSPTPAKGAYRAFVVNAANRELAKSRPVTVVWAKRATQKCRKLSGLTRAPKARTGGQEEPECEYTVTYNFSSTDPFSSVSGHGTLSGTSVNALKPVATASDTDENIIHVKSLGRSIVVDVNGAIYRHPKGGPRTVVLNGTVFRSNAPACPQREHVVVLVTEAANPSGADRVEAGLTLEKCHLHTYLPDDAKTVVTIGIETHTR
jgi:hypothetical protein